MGLGRFDHRKDHHSDGRVNEKAGQPFGSITLDEIAAMMNAPPVAPKNSGAWMLASCDNSARARSFNHQAEHGEYAAFLIDVDKGNHPLEQVANLTSGLLPGRRALIHSSGSASVEDRRWHIILPLEMLIPYRAFVCFQRALFRAFEYNEVGCDWTMSRAAQLFYLPAVGFPGGYFDKIDLPGVPYDPRETDWLNEHAAALYHEDAEREVVESRGDGPASVIGWVRRNFHTEDLLESYGYQMKPSGREWASPYQQQSSGGRRYGTLLRPDGSWFSLSDSDRAAGIGKETHKGQHGDAFDLIVHFGFGGDFDSALAWAQAERDRQFDENTHIARLKADMARIMQGAGQ